MSSVIKISRPVKDILNIFILHHFAALTVQQVADELRQNHNSIYQTILRDKGTIFETSGTKPKKVTVKKGVKEVVFYRFNNQCSVCKRTLNPEELQIHVLEEQAQDLQAWDNLVPICANCQGSKSTLIPQQGQSRKTRDKTKESKNPQAWEYLTVQIRARKGYSKAKSAPAMPGKFTMFPELTGGFLNIGQEEFIYYEFIEIDDVNAVDDDKWSYLVDDKDGDEIITSRSVTNVLNYFGEDGWELISTCQFQPQFGTPIFIVSGEFNQVHECIFKRKVTT